MITEISTMKSGGVKILTNKRPRPLLSGCELTDKERQEFNHYISDDEMNSAVDRFFRYRRQVYDMQDISIVNNSLPANHPLIAQKWEGFEADGYFSGVCVKYCHREDLERWGYVIVGFLTC